MTEIEPATILYTRVSTEEQAESGLGLDAQLGRLRAMATMNEWANVIELTDRGYSAKNLDRPAITAALAMLAAGTAATLAVTKLDRLSRSVADFANIVATAKEQDWSLVVLDLGVDTSKASGQLVANVMMAIAEWEREEIRERTMAALNAKRRRGERLGRRPLTHPELRLKIAAARNAGNTYAGIAAALNEEDVATPNGGRQWWPSTVRSIVVSVERDEERARLVAKGTL